MFTGLLVKLYFPVTVISTPDGLFQIVDTSGGTSSSVTASASGGTGSYTYHWEDISGSILTITSPNTASTGFGYSGLGVGDSSPGTMKCTATDTLGSNGYIIIDVEIVRGS